MISNQLAALDGLKEGVMEVSRHPSAFRQSLIEAGADRSRNLPHAQSVDNAHDEATGDKAESSEPVCLIPRRRDAEVQSGTSLVPDTIVVACDHAKLVSPWAKVIIESLPPCSWLLPDCIAAFQFVAKAHFLWNYKAQCRVVNFKITRKRRKTKIFARKIFLSVGNNLFNTHRRG